MAEPLTLADLAGRRVAIWGAGREGRAALAAVRAAGAGSIALLDDRPLGAAAAELDLDGVEIAVGGELAAALGRAEIVVKSPGVSLYRDEVQRALGAGVRFTSGTRLWLAENPRATSVAITGTKGKSTTAALLAHMLEAAGVRSELCGNIGRPLLALLELEPGPEVWVIELSSYQTADLDVWPAWGVLLNLHPEHLDWHAGSVDTYYADKLRLLTGLQRGRSVVAADEPRALAATAGREPLLFNHSGGLRVEESAIWDGEERLTDPRRPPLRGDHNLENACAALTVARALGVSLEACLGSLSSYRGLPHRLELLGERDGLLWVDDSISTIPQSALAALAAFRGRELTLLAGGFDRGVDYGPLATALAAGAAGAVVTLPPSGERLATAIRAAAAAAGSSGPALHPAADLGEAVQTARAVTPPGGVVLLSPAAASYGAFADFRERGRAFAAAAGFSVAS